MRKRTLRKAAEATTPDVEPVATMNVANFLAARRKQIPPLTVLPMADVEVFLANEPMEAIPVKVVKPIVEEPIQAPGGPIPSILCHPLSSNFQHILEDIDMESEESVGMRDGNMGPSTAAVEKTPRKPLSPIPEARASSWAPTLKRPRSSIPAEADRASGRKGLEHPSSRAQ